MILKQCLYSGVEDIYDDMVNGESGTSTTLFDKSQTGVITAIATSDIVLSDKVFSGDTINVTYLMSTALGNGDDVSEYEVNDGSGVAYNRVLKASFGKADEVELTMLHSFQFQIV